MQKIIISSVIVIISLAAMAQEDRKVAVFDPAGNVEPHLKEIVREEISSIVVNTAGYTVLERQLIDRVLAENRFQASGLVDDTQISEMGRLMGANLAFVASVATLGSNFHISCKLIDVHTARIERQRTAQTQRGLNDLVEVVQRMVREMFVDAAPPQQTVAERQQQISQQANNRRIVENTNVVSTFETNTPRTSSIARQRAALGELSFFFEGYDDIVREVDGDIPITITLDNGVRMTRLGVVGSLKSGFSFKITAPSSRRRYGVYIGSSNARVKNNNIRIDTHKSYDFEFVVEKRERRGVTYYRFVMK